MKKDFNLTVEDFLDNCYSWLCEPRNRCVEEYHYIFKEAGMIDDLRENVKGFLIGRIIQGEDRKLDELPEGFLDEAADLYIANMD